MLVVRGWGGALPQPSRGGRGPGGQEGGLHDHIPPGRYGDPADIARLTANLCSEAAGWVTGQSFVAGGGALAWLDLPWRPKPPDPVDPA